MWLKRPENQPRLLGTGEAALGLGLVDRSSDRGMLRHVRALHQALGALAFVHGRELVHGDLKLENILVDDGDIKLADFDFASSDPADAKAASSLLTTRAGVGTPAYMPPEVVLLLLAAAGCCCCCCCCC